MSYDSLYKQHFRPLKKPKIPKIQLTLQIVAILIRQYYQFSLYTIVYISDISRSGKKVGRIRGLKFRKSDFAVQKLGNQDKCRILRLPLSQYMISYLGKVVYK